MGKRITSRVYLKSGSDYLEFMWFAEGDDGSIYFSSSNSKIFNEGYAGDSYANKTTGGIFYPELGSKLTNDEIRGKTSLHQSGVINHSVYESEGIRKRSRSKPLDEYAGYLPIASVIPMQPSKYPDTKKKIKSHDLILDLSDFDGKVHGLLFYAKRIGKPFCSDAIDKIKQNYSHTVTKCAALKSWELYVTAYKSSQSLERNWPDKEYTIRAEPDSNGVINFPMFDI